MKAHLHSHFSVSEREDLGRVGERNGSFTGGVEGSEEEDEEGDERYPGAAVRRNVEAEAGSEEGPCHVGEGEEEEVAATEGINSLWYPS